MAKIGRVVLRGRPPLVKRYHRCECLSFSFSYASVSLCHGCGITFGLSTTCQHQKQSIDFIIVFLSPSIFIPHLIFHSIGNQLKFLATKIRRFFLKIVNFSTVTAQLWSKIKDFCTINTKWETEVLLLYKSKNLSLNFDDGDMFLLD